MFNISTYIVCMYIQQNCTEKNDFAEVSKNLDTDLKIILLDCQNNVGRSSNVAKRLFSNQLERPNYFDGLTKLFSDLFN